MKKATLGISLGAAIALASCSGGSGGASGTAPAASEGSTEVVATIGSQTITLGDLEAQLAKQPITKARLTDLERKKEFVENMIRYELLAQEAERRGLGESPEVREAMRRVMVQKLTQEEIGEKETPVSEEEARAFYEENLHDFVKPERARLSHVFFEAPKGDAKRNRVRAEAERALAEVRKGDRSVFSELAKKRSDDNRSKRAGGDLSFRTQEEYAKMWGEEFARAGFSLTTVGQIAELVVTDGGFHIVKLLGRQDAMERSFESVRQSIENRLEREKKTQAFEAFVESLREKASPKVNEDVLAKLEGGTQIPGAMPLDGGRPSPAKPAPVPAKAE